LVMDEFVVMADAGFAETGSERLVFRHR
jgi:hypothetical protein